jgi:hypothetical protein
MRGKTLHHRAGAGMSLDCKYYESCLKRLKTYPENHCDRKRTDLEKCSPTKCLDFDAKLMIKKSKKTIDN